MASEEAKPTQAAWIKIVHVLCMACFFTAHFGLLRHHMSLPQFEVWNFLMVTWEIMVLIMHAVGLTKTALLFSIGEMAGGHMQHFFFNGYPTLLDGILSTFPLMNLYLLQVSLSYFTAPWTRPANRPTFKAWAAALAIGCQMTLFLMIITAIAPLEVLLALPLLHALPKGPHRKLQRLAMDLLSSE
mmetsp:Transcript_103432/g.301781  ORF Transcript_103432/g.301781 Transcript_103432/m.301781 type:complete len:186 (-) Transcript_103432:83-640(-)